jgi:DNA-binding transcriptional regulator GbsR (MarR family)
VRKITRKAGQKPKRAGKTKKRVGTDRTFEERVIIEEFKNSKYKFRTVSGLAAETELSESRVASIIKRFEHRNLVRRSYLPAETGEELWTWIGETKRSNQQQEQAVVRALKGSDYAFRTIAGISSDTDLSEPRVKTIIKALARRNLVRRSYFRHHETGEEMWGLKEHIAAKKKRPSKAQLSQVKGKLNAELTHVGPRPEKNAQDLVEHASDLVTELARDRPDINRTKRLYETAAKIWRGVKDTVQTGAEVVAVLNTAEKVLKYAISWLG